MKYFKSWWYLQSGCEVTWFFRYAPHLLRYLMSEPGRFQSCILLQLHQENQHKISESSTKTLWILGYIANNCSTEAGLENSDKMYNENNLKHRGWTWLGVGLDQRLDWTTLKHCSNETFSIIGQITDQNSPSK